MQPGDSVLVLDETRLGFLEEQRDLLGRVMPATGTFRQQERRDEQIGLVADSVFAEVDYATMGQAVPNFDKVAGNIRSRAPDDATYQQAINIAKLRMEAKWKAEGRTPDQIGKLLEAGQAGDFGKVRELSKQQLIAVADELGPDATPEEISAAIIARTGVYSTYVTGDPRYVEAIKLGAGDASHEVLVNRPIQTVLDVAEAGGADWHNKSISQLRAVTDPATHTPEQVLAILSDPRIQHLVRQSLRHAETLDAPEQGSVWQGWGQADTILTDLSAIYSAAFYADGNTPGRGKQLVDDMAGFIADNTKNYGGDDATNERIAYQVGLEWNGAFYNAAGEGNIALALAVAAKTRNTDHPAFTEQWAPDGAVAEGIHNYALNIERLADTASENSRFITNPLASVGAHYLSDNERTALIDKMLAESDPEKVAQLEADLLAWTQALEGREPLQFALDAYKPALQGSEGFDRAVTELGKIPKPDPLPQAPGIAPTNSLWFQRCTRLLGSTLIKHWLPTAAVGPFDRASRGFSTYLFSANAAALVNSEFIDQLYVPLHSAMAVSEASKAFLPGTWRAAMFGTDAAGNPRTPFNVGVDASHARINALHVSDNTKSLLRSVATGTILAPLDTLYIGVDGFNSFAYFTGATREDQKKDMVRGFAYGIVTAGDFGFLAAANASTSATGLFLGRTAFFWTGVGAALLVIGSGMNYVKGLYDQAHAFDAETAKAWELLGIDNPETASKLGVGATFGDGDAYKNAGPFLVEVFRHAGYTPQQMVAFINQNWTPEQADKLATHIKRTATRRDDGSYSEEDYASIEMYAENVGIKFPDYYNESNTPFKPDPNATTWEWVGP